MPLSKSLELDKQGSPLRAKLLSIRCIRNETCNYLSEIDWSSSQDFSNMSQKAGIQQKGDWTPVEVVCFQGNLKGKCEQGSS